MFRPLLLIPIAAINILVAADVSGKWTGTMETNGSRVRIYVTINQHDQEISGTVATGDEARPVPIEKAEMHGDQVMFEVHDNANRIVKFRLSLTGAVLGGEAAAGDQVFIDLAADARQIIHHLERGITLLAKRDWLVRPARLALAAPEFVGQRCWHGFLAKIKNPLCWQRVS